MSLMDDAGFKTVDLPGLSALRANYAYNTEQRLDNYYHFWQFYKGTHWTYNPTSVEGDRNITINYCRRLVDVHANFLFKQGFDITIPDDPGTTDDEKTSREFQKLLLDHTWEMNDKFMWGLEAAQMGGITGDVFLYHSWEENHDLWEPHVRIDVLPSQFCFPEFGGPEGRDRKKMTKLYIAFPKFKQSKFGDPLSFHANNDVVLHVEEWTKNKVIYYEDNVKIREEQNDLGEIPVVHIPNYPIAGEFYGLSDLADLTELQEELNEKATDIGSIINYHGSPTTIVKGADINSIEMGSNKAFGVPADADVVNLEMKGDLKANIQWYQLIKDTILEISSTPENAIASSQAMESKIAAAALAVHYLPMLDKRKIKTNSYGLGIRKSNRLIMKIQEVMDPKFKKKMDALGDDVYAKYRTEVVWPEPFPRNELNELEKYERQLKIGLTHRREILEKMGKGQKEIDDILAAVKKEQQEALELMMMQRVQGQTQQGKNQEGIPKPNSGNPTPRRPDTTKQGDSLSKTTEDRAMK